tara:strand:- start:3994 stop:6297 length:2304 start_codon:yes stop_codon:yes gene_type:complete
MAATNYGGVLDKYLFNPLEKNAKTADAQELRGSMLSGGLNTYGSSQFKNIALEQQRKLIDTVGGPSSFSVSPSGGFEINDTGKQYLARALEDEGGRQAVNQYINSSYLFTKEGVNDEGVLTDFNVQGLSPIGDGTYAVDLNDGTGKSTVATDSNNADGDSLVSKLDIQSIADQFAPALRKAIADSGKIDPGLSANQMTNSMSKLPGGFENNRFEFIQKLDFDVNTAKGYVANLLKDKYINEDQAAGLMQQLNVASTPSEVAGAISTINSTRDSEIGSDRVKALTSSLDMDDEVNQRWTAELSKNIDGITELAKTNPQFNQLLKNFANTEGGGQQLVNLLNGISGLDDETLMELAPSTTPKGIRERRRKMVDKGLIPDSSILIDKSREGKAIEALLNPNIVDSYEAVEALYNQLPTTKKLGYDASTGAEKKAIVSFAAQDRDPEQVAALADTTRNNIVSGNFLNKDGSKVNPESGLTAMLTDLQESSDALALATTIAHTMSDNPAERRTTIADLMSIYETGAPVAVIASRNARKLAAAQIDTATSKGLKEDSIKTAERAQKSVGKLLPVNEQLFELSNEIYASDGDFGNFFFNDEDSDLSIKTKQALRTTLNVITPLLSGEKAGLTFGSTVESNAIANTYINAVSINLIREDGDKLFGSPLTPDNPKPSPAYDGVGLLFKVEPMYKFNDNGTIKVNSFKFKNEDGTETARDVDADKLSKIVPDKMQAKTIELMLRNKDTSGGKALIFNEGGAPKIWSETAGEYVEYKG